MVLKPKVIHLLIVVNQYSRGFELIINFLLSQIQKHHLIWIPGTWKKEAYELVYIISQFIKLIGKKLVWLK